MQNASSISPSLHNQDVRDPLLLQRQATNFKQLLRKQLDKLSQPKVLPPEMHFIPNPSNPEFICYIGLENVVDYLTGHNTTQQPPDPFECVQCGTDFTPVWKWQDRTDPSKPSVICEKCVSKNVKKLALEEYNKEVNNFSKIYEELEKQFASAGTLTPPSAAISPSLGQSTSQRSSSSTNLSAASNSNLFSNNAAAAAAVAAAANFSLASLQQAHSNSNFSSLSQQQMTAMAAFLMSQTATAVNNTGNSNQLSTPPAAHSSSSSGSSRNATNSAYNSLASAFTNNAFTNNAANTSANTAATLALLQQFSKLNNPTQLNPLLLQLGALGATGGAAGGTLGPNNTAAAMAQLLSFPNLYSNLLNSYSSHKSTSGGGSGSNTSAQSTMNATMAGLQRQLLMEMLPNTSGTNRSAHSSNSMQHHNWKS